jgi:hypothetical protein
METAVGAVLVAVVAAATGSVVAASAVAGSAATARAIGRHRAADEIAGSSAPTGTGPRAIIPWVAMATLRVSLDQEWRRPILTPTSRSYRAASAAI